MNTAKDFFDTAFWAERPVGHSFVEKESRCKQLFQMALRHFGPFFHLHTPEKHPVIFRDTEDYRVAMTIVAMCAHDCLDIKIITFELMSNHVHFILCGTKEACRRYFALFKLRLKRYFERRKMAVDLSGFTEDFVSIETLESLRNQIGYTNRNNFLVDPSHTPFSYPFGASNCYFLDVNKKRVERWFGQLTAREKRALLHTHETDYPNEFALIDGYISPASFCAISFGEHIFRDARHYFFKVSREIEGYKEVAEALGESVYYTDDELNAVLYKICKESYNGQRATLLPQNEKLDLARTLHYDYNADNEKIARLLKLTPSLVDSMFPTRKR
jgi:REP element-mobilizing transposase RayT